MTIHQNSREAYASLDLAQRDKEVVLAFWSAGGSATDRTIASLLGADDLNYCRPTITRLTERGILRETGSVICVVTNKKVRVSTLNPVETIANLPPEEPVTETPTPYVATQAPANPIPIAFRDDDLRVIVMDDAGPGGAHHEYRIAILGPPVAVTGPDGVELQRRPALQTIDIKFQKGGKQDHGPNGLTNELLLALVRHRLECFQAGPFPCKENDAALRHVAAAADWLNRRTAKRRRRGVEGKEKA